MLKKIVLKKKKRQLDVTESLRKKEGIKERDKEGEKEKNKSTEYSCSCTLA